MIQRIKDELKRRITNFSTMHNSCAQRGDIDAMARIDSSLAQLRNLLAYIEVVEQGHQGLDEAREFSRYLDYMYEGRYEKGSQEYIMLDKCARHFYNFGKQMCANRGVEQFVKAEATVGYYNQGGLSILTTPSIKKLGFKEGDKLTLQITKNGD